MEKVQQGKQLKNLMFSPQKSKSILSLPPGKMGKEARLRFRSQIKRLALESCHGISAREPGVEINMKVQISYVFE